MEPETPQEFSTNKVWIYIPHGELETPLPFRFTITPKIFNSLLRYSNSFVSGATIRQIRDAAREIAKIGEIAKITLISGATLYLYREGQVFYHLAESNKSDRSDIQPYTDAVMLL